MNSDVSTEEMVWNITALTIWCMCLCRCACLWIRSFLFSTDWSPNFEGRLDCAFYLPSTKMQQNGNRRLSIVVLPDESALYLWTNKYKTNLGTKYELYLPCRLHGLFLPLACVFTSWRLLLFVLHPWHFTCDRNWSMIDSLHYQVSGIWSK